MKDSVRVAALAPLAVLVYPVTALFVIPFQTKDLAAYELLIVLSVVALLVSYVASMTVCLPLYARLKKLGFRRLSSSMILAILCGCIGLAISQIDFGLAQYEQGIGALTAAIFGFVLGFALELPVTSAYCLLAPTAE